MLFKTKHKNINMGVKVLNKKSENKNSHFSMPSNFTLTNLETPDSCIVIPYKVFAYSIVFFLCVITIN